MLFFLTAFATFDKDTGANENSVVQEVSSNIEYIIANNDKMDFLFFLY